MDSALDKAAADEIGHADLRVQALEESGLSQATVDVIDHVAGVSVAAPALERKTYLATSLTQTPSAKLPAPVTVLGIDPVQEPILHDLPLVSGRLLATADGQSALITQTLASVEHLGVGGTITLNGTVASGPQAFNIVGIVTGDGPLPEAEGRLIFLSLDSAQALFGTTGITRVDLRVAPGVSVDELMGQFDVTIQTQPYLLSRTQDLADSLRAETADFRVALLLVAAVVLFAGAFLIFNTLSMTVAERGREVGLLRAAGTTRSQVMNFVLLQAFVLGIAGSVLGVVWGIGMAVITLAWVGSSGSITLSAPSLSAASVVATPMRRAMAIEPAWRAGRIPPVEALR